MANKVNYQENIVVDLSSYTMKNENTITVKGKMLSDAFNGTIGAGEVEIDVPLTYKTKDGEVRRNDYKAKDLKETIGENGISDTAKKRQVYEFRNCAMLDDGRIISNGYSSRLAQTKNDEEFIVTNKLAHVKEMKESGGKLRQTTDVIEADYSVPVLGANECDYKTAEMFANAANKVEDEAVKARFSSYAENFPNLSTQEKLTAAIDFVTNSKEMSTYFQKRANVRMIELTDDGKVSAVKMGFVSATTKNEDGSYANRTVNDIVNDFGKDLEFSGNLKEISQQLEAPTSNVVIEVMPRGSYNATQNLDNIHSASAGGSAKMKAARRNQNTAVYNPKQENGFALEAYMPTTLAIKQSENHEDYFYVNNFSTPVNTGYRDGEINPLIGNYEVYTKHTVHSIVSEMRQEIGEAFTLQAKHTSEALNRNNWKKDETVEQKAEQEVEKTVDANVEPAAPKM